MLTPESKIKSSLQDVSGNILADTEHIVRLGSAQKDNFGNITAKATSSRGRKIRLRFTFYGQNILRVTATFGKKLKDESYLLDSALTPAKTTFKKSVSKITACTGKTTLTIIPKPWQFSLRHKGNIIYVQQVNDSDVMGDFVSLPIGRGVRSKDGLTCMSSSIAIKPEEKFFGLGERFDQLCKRGHIVTSFTLAPLVSNPMVSYKPTPFFFSNKGYGVFVNTLEPVVFDFTATSYESVCFTHPGDTLDYFIIIGPKPSEIIKGYHRITGKPEVPPEWSFGFMQSSAAVKKQDGADLFGYKSTKEVINVAKRLRKEKIPCEGITLDTPWSGNYYKSKEIYNWEFSKRYFPEPEKMATKLKEMGFRLCVTLWPYVMEYFPDFKELKAKGLLVKNSKGQPYLNEITDTYFLDLTNPKACLWLENKMRKARHSGVSAIMADFCELYPLDGFYYNGMSGLKAHNLMPLLYQKLLYKITQEEDPERGVLWARAGYAGSHKTPGHWAGDNRSSFNSLASLIRAGLNFSLSGGICWGHDIGGFFENICDRNKNGSPWEMPSKELYIRWAQFGFFSPWLRTHGGNPREPWVFGRETLDIFRKYAQFRARLIPYVYSCAFDARVTGRGIMRAMFLEFGNDPVCWNINHQYMFGPSLLIAPIYNEDNKVEIYLPKGRWQDIWNKKIYTGPQWLNQKVNLDKIPVFQRENTILPLGRIRNHVDEKSPEPFDLWAFVEKNVSFKLYLKGKAVTLSVFRQNGLLSGKSSSACRFKIIDRGV